MPVSSFEVAFELVKRLDESVRCKDVRTITQNVQATLTDIIQSGELTLPGRFQAVPPAGYSRRLLHRNPELGYTALIMTWPPSHATPLHDQSVGGISTFPGGPWDWGGRGCELWELDPWVNDGSKAHLERLCEF
ncbi:MAG: hypothetical protein AB1486_33900 [Planctomycetota bacterium]